MTSPPGGSAESKVRCWGWCKACHWLRRWKVQHGMWWVCPAGHYGGWNGVKPD